MGPELTVAAFAAVGVTVAGCLSLAVRLREKHLLGKALMRAQKDTAPNEMNSIFYFSQVVPSPIFKTIFGADNQLAYTLHRVSTKSKNWMLKKGDAQVASLSTRSRHCWIQLTQEPSIVRRIKLSQFRGLLTCKPLMGNGILFSLSKDTGILTYFHQTSQDIKTVHVSDIGKIQQLSDEKSFRLEFNEQLIDPDFNIALTFLAISTVWRQRRRYTLAKKVAAKRKTVRVSLWRMNRNRRLQQLQLSHRQLSDTVEGNLSDTRQHPETKKTNKMFTNLPAESINKRIKKQKMPTRSSQQTIRVEEMNGSIFIPLSPINNTI